MPTDVWNSGIDVVGDLAAWGSHFCLFYETKEDLLDSLVSYYKSGLECGEYCLWIVGEPLTIEEAEGALKDAVPDLDRHMAECNLEFTSARDWFLQGRTFDGKRVTGRFYEKLARSSARGYRGMRVAGDTTWLLKKDWTDFCNYEDGLNEVIGNQRMAGLCSYPLAACGAPEILDVVRTHQFALARRHGRWDVVESAGLKRAKAELKRLNEELEERVLERTNELKKAEQRYRLMVETDSDAVICTDESGIILLANPATMVVFGYEPAELIGKPLTMLMPEFMRKAHEAGFRRYLATSQRHLNWHGTEFTGLRRNGEEFPVEVSFGEVTADSHRIFTGFVRDISERKQAEELRASLHATQVELARISRLTTMGELTASLAHEIKQPIGATVTNAEACLRLLDRDQPDLPEAREAALEMVKDAKRAAEIIDRVRSLYQKGSLQVETIQVGEVIGEMVIMLQSEANRHLVTICTDLAEGLPAVVADRVQFQQALMNLMLNGIEAMRGIGGELSIKAQSATDGQLLISVADTGVGLPADNAGKIFDAFFTTKPQGTGLGLAITRSIVESHGGRI